MRGVPPHQSNTAGLKAQAGEGREGGGEDEEEEEEEMGREQREGRREEEKKMRYMTQSILHKIENISIQITTHTS